MISNNRVAAAILGLFLLTAVAFAADITGTWTASFDTQVGVQNYTFTFKVEGNKLTGRLKSTFAESEISEGSVNGDDISFVENMMYEGMPLRIMYKGKVSGDEIKITRIVLEDFPEVAVAKRSK
jgi:hypothetical protein